MVGTAENIDTDGDMQVATGMVNAWADAEPLDDILVSLGFGVGAAYVNFNEISAVLPRTKLVFLDDSTIEFAYQFGGGLGYRITDAISIGVAYRFIATTDPEFDSPLGDFKAEYDSHNVFIGLRYVFGD